MTIEIRFDRDISTMAYRFWIFDTETMSIAEDLVFRKLSPMEYNPPTFTVPIHEGSMLMEAMVKTLKSMGFVEPDVSKQTLDAKDFHLQDMRKLVFKEQKEE